LAKHDYPISRQIPLEESRPNLADRAHHQFPTDPGSDLFAPRMKQPRNVHAVTPALPPPMTMTS
jgi:hypothetical protein